VLRTVEIGVSVEPHHSQSSTPTAGDSPQATVAIAGEDNRKGTVGDGNSDTPGETPAELEYPRSLRGRRIYRIDDLDRDRTLESSQHARGLCRFQQTGGAASAIDTSRAIVVGGAISRNSRHARRCITSPRDQL
jgi:hypothetical protein